MIIKFLKCMKKMANKATTAWLFGYLKPLISVQSISDGF